MKHLEKDFIPLFPLPMVVGPGETVSLHIFEPRYRQLMKDLRAVSGLKHVLPFGLSLFREKQKKVEEFGCTVRIEEIVKSYPDGRMDIIGRGDLRYHLGEIDRELPYARGHIEYIVDSDPEVNLTILAEATRAVEKLRREVLDRTDAAPHHAGYPVSFQLAHEAGLDVEAKYHLLGLRSETDRLRVVRDQSRKALQLLRKARAIRERVQRNGHFQEFPKIEF